VLSLADDGSLDPLAVCAHINVCVGIVCRPKRAYAFGIARSRACVLRVGVRLWMATDAPLLRLSLHRRALAVLH
jgi:hypothetical protein